RLWQNVQHLPIRKGRELLKQHPIEAAEIDRVYGEIFEKLRPHREEHILTEEQYENLYQSQKEEIIEEVVTGDVDLFLYFLKFYGPRLLAEPRILSLVQEWWLAKGKDKKARGNIQKICAALSEYTGRPEELTAEARKQRRTASSLQAQRDRRASRYGEQAWQQYLAKRRQLGSKDKDLLRQAAGYIAQEEFSHKTVAKREAKRLFWQRVEQDLSK